MKTYTFRATRKSNGTEIHSYFIHDLDDEGTDAISAKIKAALIQSHPLARALSGDDIDVELSEMSPVED